jgi:hypothetical protein
MTPNNRSVSTALPSAYYDDVVGPFFEIDARHGK